MILTKLGFEDKLQKKTRSYTPAAVAFGTGLAARKVVKDVSGAENKIHAWDSSLAKHRFETKDRSITFGEADEIFDRYVHGGQDLSRHKILGVRAGRLMGVVPHVQEKLESLESHISGRGPLSADRKHELAKTKEHYKMYTSSSETPESLKAHMIEKGLNDKSMEGAALNLNEGVKKIIADTKTYPTFEAQHTALNKIDPKAAHTFHKAIVGNEGAMGEARRLVGNTKDVLSTPEVYNIHLRPHIRKIKEVASLSSKTLLGVGGLMAGGIALSKYLKKEAKQKKDNRFAPSVAVAAGAPIAAVGMKKIIKPEKDIAITYGTMSNIGFGHKAPGIAIQRALKEDSRFKNINVDTLERDPHHIFRGSSKRYGLAVDTGFGGSIPEGWGYGDQTLKQTHGVGSPSLKTNKWLRYQTDAMPEHGYTSGTTAWRKGDRILAYGDNLHHFKDRGIKPLRVGEYTPALDPEAIREIHNYSADEDVMTKLISHHELELKGVTDPQITSHHKETIDALKQHKGKKFISVAGAGRGDYVGIRAKELADQLRTHGLDKEYSVMAMYSGSRGHAQAKLTAGDKLVVPVGRLPRSLYNEVQSKATVNWGATGTSSVGETLHMKNIQAYPKNWGRIHAGAPVDPGTISHRQDAALGFKGEHANVQEWNKGNMEYAHKQKGVIQADTAEDIIKTLKDPAKFQELGEGAKLRSLEHHSNYVLGKKKMVDTIHSELRRSKNITRLKGLPLAVAGGALALYGGKQLYDSYKNKELKPLRQKIKSLI